MNSSGPISPRRGVANNDMPKAAQMPEELQRLLVGRIVRKIVAGVVLEGEVQEYASLDIYQRENGDILLTSTLNVEWRDAKNPAARTREILGESQVWKMATDRFTESAWVAPRIQHLQKAGWDLSKMDASAAAHEEAVWQALRNVGIARKAGLHAHAMLRALEGGELVIPPPPGMPDHSRAENIPLVMPQKQYNTLGNAAKGPSTPIAWKLAAPQDVSNKDKRLGRKLATEAEALREWLRVQKAQLAKVQKRKQLRTRLRHITARLADLEAAVLDWDDDSPPEILPSPGSSKGKALAGSGEIMSKAHVEHTITRYKKQIRDYNAASELILSDAKLEAEADALLQADIAEQKEVVKQAEELLTKAELRLKEFEAKMGLTRVRAKGRGVLSMKPRAAVAARPRPAPKRKPAAASAAGGAGSKKAKTLPKTAIVVGPKLGRASPKKAKKTPLLARPLPDSDFASDSDGDVEMADPEPSERDTAIWGSEELVYLGGHFFPKRYVMVEGDMPVEEWTRKEASGELEADEYEVDAIVAEKLERKSRKFLVKWKGFELHPEQWFPHQNFENCEALDDWENRKAALESEI